MPRQQNRHRNLEIVVGAEAVEEALAMWVTKYHGFDIDRKHIEIVLDGDKITAKITKRAESESLELPPSE